MNYGIGKCMVGWFLRFPFFPLFISADLDCSSMWLLIWGIPSQAQFYGACVRRQEPAFIVPAGLAGGYGLFILYSFSYCSLAMMIVSVG